MRLPLPPLARRITTLLGPSSDDPRHPEDRLVEHATVRRTAQRRDAGRNHGRAPGARAVDEWLVDVGRHASMDGQTAATAESAATTGIVDEAAGVPASRQPATDMTPVPSDPSSVEAGAAGASSAESEEPFSRSGDPVIALRNVSRRYAGADGIVALEDANLAIWPGEFVVVVGPSGSGKTTLLNLIGGMDQPSTGDIVATGHRISGASPAGLSRYRRESVSFIFQTFNLFPALTAIENVEFGASVARRRGARAAARAMMTKVGLDHRLRHFPHMLSGGEQQRVAIARALATGNRIVLADEPTGELDFRSGLQILELLQAQAAAGHAVIVVTHNREIARVADRVIELSSGRIVSDRAVDGPRPRLEDLHW